MLRLSRKSLFVVLSISCLSILGSWLLNPPFRLLTANMFVLFTENHVSFEGLDHDLNSYYVFAALSFLLLLGCFFLSQVVANSVKAVLLLLFTFITCYILTVYIDSASKLAVCTACADGKRRLNYSEVDFNLHYAVAISIALLVSGIRYKRYTSKE